MLNERGSAFIESILTLSILFTLTSLFPFVFHLKHSLYNEMLELHASEVAYEAVMMAETIGVSSGKKQIENTEYYWEFDGESVCVEFYNLDGERRKCINQEGEF